MSIAGTGRRHRGPRRLRLVQSRRDRPPGWSRPGLSAPIPDDHLRRRHTCTAGAGSAPAPLTPTRSPAQAGARWGEEGEGGEGYSPPRYLGPAGCQCTHTHVSSVSPAFSRSQLGRTAAPQSESITQCRNQTGLPRRLRRGGAVEEARPVRPRLRRCCRCCCVSPLSGRARRGRPVLRLRPVQLRAGPQTGH